MDIDIIIFKTNTGRLLSKDPCVSNYSNKIETFYRFNDEDNGSYCLSYCLKTFNVDTIFLKSKNIILRVGEIIKDKCGKNIKIYGLLIDPSLDDGWICSDLDFINGMSLNYYLSSSFKVGGTPKTLVKIDWGAHENDPNYSYFSEYEDALKYLKR